MGATSAEGGGETDKINEDLWYACAGPLACIPAHGSLVLYFPQGHSEQVAASMPRNSDARIPSYPNLPWKLACLLLSVSLRADPDTDDVFAKMTLQPLSTASEEGVAAAASDPGLKSETTDSEFFCKTLTASDTSTHGGFSVPRRSAENVFPPLDYSVQPPAQELRARDLHGNLWIFRHIYRGQPKRHLLTTGWSTFVTAKRLVAGDSVLFIRNRTKEKELLVGIRRANRQPSNVSSSGLSSESIQIGILAAAAHAYASLSPFTVFYNPRASSSPFVIPMAKYKKAVYSHCADLGTRFRMILEAEDSSKRSHTGTITAIGDVDPVRWNNSRWRNLQVEWDEPVPAERRSRVSIWEIDPVQEPFVISTPPLQEVDSLLNLKRAAPWNCTEISFEDSGSFKKINASTFRPTVTQPQDSLFLPRKQNPSWAYDIPQAQAQAQALLEQPASQSFQRVQELLTTTPAEGAFCFPWAGSVLPRTFSGYLENFQETSPSPLLYPSSPFLRECPDQANSVSLDNLLDPLVSDAAVAAEDRVPHSSSTVARDYEAPASFAPALGVLDVATAFESSPMTRASTSWTPPLPVAPPSNKRRTYTKVYKRGAVGRSIDVGRYCGYEKLKRDLARMFNIEGQLEEDRQKRGWKLVYVDHEDDVLLVGDDPWEEFVNCVRCIKILSPQEVDQMSLDGAEAASAPPFLI